MWLKMGVGGAPRAYFGSREKLANTKSFVQANRTAGGKSTEVERNDSESDTHKTTHNTQYIVVCGHESVC